MTVWNPPPDIDPECIELCAALNAMPGVHTLESCCGHLKDPFCVYFGVDALQDLPAVLYWFDSCHSGVPGWHVKARTDCGRSPAYFTAEGPVGDYAGADAIAKCFRDWLDDSYGEGVGDDDD